MIPPVTNDNSAARERAKRKPRRKRQAPVGAPRFYYKGNRGGEWQKSVFLDVIEYLDAKSESDFNISVNLYSGVDAKASKKIRSAFYEGRQEAGLFVRAETR